MSDPEFDVVVVGAGNAALCAALAAEENGAKVLVLERANEDESGGNSRFTAGAMRVVYDGVRRPQGLDARPHQRGDRQHRFRHLHPGSVLRRHGAGHAIPGRSGHGRVAGHALARHPPLDAREGGAVRADLGPPGIQGRRQVQVLGRAHGGGLGRRSRAGRFAARDRDETGHRDPLRPPRHGADLRRRDGERRRG